MVQSCRGFAVPGPLQSVQRAEFWGVILALQASAPLHLEIDSLHVVRHGGRLLDGGRNPCPAELVEDADLILLIERILHLRSRDTVRDTKVKAMLVRAWFRAELDGIGNNEADGAAAACWRWCCQPRLCDWR